MYDAFKDKQNSFINLWVVWRLLPRVTSSQQPSILRDLEVQGALLWPNFRWGIQMQKEIRWNDDKEKSLFSVHKWVVNDLIFG